jgi:hypothetical protein
MTSSTPSWPSAICPAVHHLDLLPLGALVLLQGFQNLFLELVSGYYHGHKPPFLHSCIPAYTIVNRESIYRYIWDGYRFGYIFLLDNRNFFGGKTSLLVLL